MSRIWTLAGLIGLTLAGCGLAMPTDPDGTLANIDGGTLRVGVTESFDEKSTWVRVEPGPDTEPSGIEVDLVREFASERDATIEWSQGSEHQLAEKLKHGRLDLVIGGFADDTPWTTHAGLTKPYAESKDPLGRTVKHVMLVPLGENAFLVELDQFLQKAGVTS
jgi:ABC-type amino acid transport substrate-binding protein